MKNFNPMVAFYECNTCEHTWFTQWRQATKFIASVDKMTDSCERCLNSNKVNSTEPHRIKFPMGMLRLK